MKDKYIHNMLRDNFDVILQYKNLIPMDYISFWYGGESWTGALLIMKKKKITIEEASALLVFRSFCLSEEWEIDNSYSDEHIKNMFYMAVSQYAENDIIKEVTSEYFIAKSLYHELVSKDSLNKILSGDEYSQISVNRLIVPNAELDGFDPLKKYVINKYFQLQDQWNSQHYILVTDDEYIYYEGWTNA